MRFFDTNILVYAATSQDPCKQRIARELIAHALDMNGDGCTSMQALQEFTAVLVRKCPDARDMAVNPFKPCHSNYQPRGSSRA